MFSPTSGNSNINLKNILNKKGRYNYDSDSTSNKDVEINQNTNNNLRNTYNKLSTTDSKSSKQNNRSASSDSASSMSSVKNQRKQSPVAKSMSPINKKSTNGARKLKSNSPETSRSETRTRSYSTSRSRSSSRTSSKSLDHVMHTNSVAKLPLKTKTVISRQPVYESNSADNYNRKRASETQLNKRGLANTRPYAKPSSNNSKRSQLNSQQRPPPEQFSKTAVRVMSAQRLKNNDLQNRISEMNLELEKLKEENKTLKRVHHREEIALKKFENQDNDITRLVKNHMEESNSLKETIKTVKNENRKLTNNLMEKDDELRNIKKKLDEYKKILNDKKLLDSAELTKRLDQANASLNEYKKKNEQLEHKIEMIEKNHKHEIGVEIAHHKETQRNLQKISDDNRELKVRLEEKERALDLTNIYSRQITNRDAPSVPLWKTSTQSLNNDSPHDKRKEYERKRKEQKQKNVKKENKNTNIKEHEVLDLDEIVNSSRSQSIISKHHNLKKEANIFVTETDDADRELEKQKEDVLRKQQELELKLKQQDNELKKKDAIERAKRQQQAFKEEEKLKQIENEKLKKEQEPESRPLAPPPSETYELNELKERKKKEKEYLEEEERKKRWISQSTINTVDDESEKNSVDKAKKEELLAKLSMLNTDNMSTKKNETSYNTTTYNLDKIENNNIKNNKLGGGIGSNTPVNKLSNNEPTFNFNSTSTTSNSSLPPKPSNQQQQNRLNNQTQSNSTEYKHSVEIENLHEGKPANWPRDTNKNDLLSKLFGDSASTQANNLNNNNIQKTQYQSKMDKVDDIFGKNLASGNNKTPPVSSKVNLLPWELQDINYNTTSNNNTIKREKSNATSNTNTVTKTDHFDFFSKLNSKNESNSFKTSSSNPPNNGIHRPKLENKIIFPSSNHNNNYTEDIEELTL